MADPGGRFFWFEYRGGDTSKAKAFYCALFGWTYEDREIDGAPYQVIRCGDYTVGGMVPDDGEPRWLAYCRCADLDAALAAAGGFDGETGDPRTIDGIGRVADVRDPQGGEIVLVECEEEPRPPGPGVPGAVAWNELATPDPKISIRFYSKVCSWGRVVHDLPGIGKYALFKDAERRDRAGMHRIPDGPAVWRHYVTTRDTTMACDRCRMLDGEVLVEDTTIEGLGTFAQLRDSNGAPFAVFSRPRRRTRTATDPKWTSTIHER